MILNINRPSAGSAGSTGSFFRLSH